jgi:hypothetical protein
MICSWDMTARGVTALNAAQSNNQKDSCKISNRRNRNIRAACVIVSIFYSRAAACIAACKIAP